MKTNLVFFILLLFLGGFLFLSNQYDYKRNGEKINRYQCQDVFFNPFPEGYDYQEYSFNYDYKSTKNRYKFSSLNLERLSLKNLPDSLFLNYEGCVTDLYLGHNNFAEIPFAIRHLHSIKVLDISNGGLSFISVPNDLDQVFNNLELLYLQNNYIDVLNYLPTSKHLQEVDLRENNITEVDLPKDASTYFVKKLDLSQNKLLEFPIQLLRINKIASLKLSENKILFIPPLDQNKIEEYQINSIDLDNNQITRFPSHFGKIKNLLTLQLEGNKIDGSVKLSNNSFPYLQELRIRSQYVDSIVIEQTAIPKATSLSLFDNNIVHFKVAKDNIQSLTSLNLRENKLTTFPYDVLHLKKLEYCDLSTNKIKGKVVISNSNIKILDLSNNQITAIHFSGKNKIKELNLHANNLVSFTFDEGSLEHLETLNLNDNSKISRAEQLRLINDIQNLNINSLEGILQIHNNQNEIFDLIDNKIRQVYLSGDNKIKELTLENNDLRAINIEEGSLKNLELFDISNNPNLKIFPFDIFTKAPNLKIIDVIGCNNLSQQDLDKIKSLANSYGVNYLMKGDVNYGNN